MDHAKPFRPNPPPLRELMGGLIHGKDIDYKGLVSKPIYEFSEHELNINHAARIQENARQNLLNSELPKKQLEQHQLRRADTPRLYAYFRNPDVLKDSRNLEFKPKEPSEELKIDFAGITEKLEKERIEREKQEKLDKERKEKEILEQERRDRELKERERIEKERLAQKATAEMPKTNLKAPETRYTPSKSSESLEYVLAKDKKPVDQASYYKELAEKTGLRGVKLDCYLKALQFNPSLEQKAEISRALGEIYFNEYNNPQAAVKYYNMALATGVDSVDITIIKHVLKPQAERLIEKWRQEKEQIDKEIKEFAATVAKGAAKGAALAVGVPVVLAGAGVYYGARGLYRLGKRLLKGKEKSELDRKYEASMKELREIEKRMKMYK